VLSCHSDVQLLCSSAVDKTKLQELLLDNFSIAVSTAVITVMVEVEASMTIIKPKSLCHWPKKEAYLERIKAQNAHSLDNCESQIYFSSVQDFLKTIKSAVNEPSA
jgi:elongation factor P--beta-lysine ligase